MHIDINLCTVLFQKNLKNNIRVKIYSIQESQNDVNVVGFDLYLWHIIKCLYYIVTLETKQYVDNGNSELCQISIFCDHCCLLVFRR